jgi:AcrB/AcrD/AcrF family
MHSYAAPPDCLLPIASPARADRVRGVSRAGLCSLHRAQHRGLSRSRPPIIEIIAQRPGQSPEEMERYVTIPIEIAIASTPGLKYIRSNTVCALSFIRLARTERSLSKIAHSSPVIATIAARSARAPAGNANGEHGQRVCDLDQPDAASTEDRKAFQPSLQFITPRKSCCSVP